MNKTYKYTSKEVLSEKFNFKNWLYEVGHEIMTNSEAKLEEIKLSEDEKSKLFNQLLFEKGLTVHIYVAGNFSKNDVLKLRGFQPASEIMKGPKCSGCKRLLTSPSQGNVEHPNHPGKCIDCGNAIEALK